MNERARDHPKGSQNDTKLKRKNGQCRLLSLPAEIRYMIWEFAIGADPILLYPSGFTKGSHGLLQDAQVAKSAMVTRKQIVSEHCADLHGVETFISTASSKKEKPRFSSSSTDGMPLPTDPAESVFSWLGTNKQIYTEAKPLVEKYVEESLTVHICDTFVFYALIRRILRTVPKAIYNNNNRNNRQGLKLRSLSLCVKLEIEIKDDHRRNGFGLSFTEGGHGWSTGHGGACRCTPCAAARSIVDAAEWFPEIQTLTLRVYFQCKQDQRNMMGRFLNGNLKYYGRRPKDPCALTLVDDSERIDDFVVNTLTGCSPFRQFVKKKQLLRKEDTLQSVKVVFCTEWISHYPRNEARFVKEKCWCEGRRIDAEQLQSTGLGEAIEKLLMPR